MADPRQIVESLCTVLAATEAPEGSSLAELAAAYAELCAQTNTRLRRCLDCLRQGLYSEAVQLAETPPNVLEMVTALDFGQRKEWDQLCVRCRLPAAPPLRVQSAQELNESYAREAELRPLLAQQRRLALARAGLKPRLRVVREIAQKDPVAACWKEDVKALEGFRLAEIRAQVARFPSGRNGAADAGERGRAAAAMLDELDDPNWRSPVPDDLRQLLEKHVLAYRKTQALADLAALIGPLEQAHGQNDFDSAVALRVRWLAALETAQGGAAADLVRRAQVVLDWISLAAQQRQIQREFEEACAGLRMGLKTKAPLEELERLHRAATAARIALPGDLAADYSAAIAAHHRRARNVRRRNLGIAIGLSLVVAGVVAGFVWQEMRRQTEQSWLTQLNTSVSSSHWEEGEGVWKRMQTQAPRLTSLEQFKNIKNVLDDNVLDQEQRAKDFARHMQAAQSAGVEAPPGADLDAAEQLALTPEEKAEVADFRQRLAAAAQQRRSAAQADFERRSAALAADASALDDKLLSDDPVDFGRKLSAAEQTDKALRAQMAGGEVGDTRQQLPGIEAQLAQARGELLTTSAQRTQLETVYQAADSATTLAAALREFTTRFPESPHAKDFNAALNYAPAWEALEKWNALLAGWGGKLSIESPAQASERAPQVADFIRRYPVSPLALDQQAYLQYLSQAQVAGDAAWKKNVAQLMASPLIADINALPTVRGVYYLRTDAKISKTSLGETFPAILTNDVTQMTNLTLKEAEVAGKLGLSPQSQLAKAVVEEMDKPASGDWETAPLAVAQEVRNQKDLDPILEAVMLEQIFRSAQTAGWGLDNVLKEPLARLEELHAQDIVWVNPTDAAAQAARPAARAAVAALPVMADLEAQVRARRQQLFDGLRWSLAGEGGLFRNAGGWQIQTHLTPDNSLQAFIVSGADPGHPEMLLIGKGKDGKWELDETKLTVAVEGSVVFICRGK